jgi:transketolase
MRQETADCIFELACADHRVVFIGSDLGAGAMQQMRSDFPERCYMEGVSEQYVIGMAAGLSAAGLIPFVNSIGTFVTRRCFEQIAIDLCLDKFSVRIIGNGGGLVYAPLGPTHIATEDLAIMRALPNMTVVAPCDGAEAVALIRQSMDWPGPMYFRLGAADARPISRQFGMPTLGKAILMRQLNRVVLVSTGTMTASAIDAAEILADMGIESGVLHCHTVKPLDAELLRTTCDAAELVVVVEETTPGGGLASAVLESLAFSGPLPRRFLRLGLSDSFISQYGSQKEILRAHNLDALGIARQVNSVFRSC